MNGQSWKVVMMYAEAHGNDVHRGVKTMVGQPSKLPTRRAAGDDQQMVDILQQIMSTSV